MITGDFRGRAKAVGKSAGLWYEAGMEFKDHSSSRINAIVFPVLFCFATSIADVTSWEFWSANPTQTWPELFKYAGYALMPFNAAALVGMIFTWPLSSTLQAVPLAGAFLSAQIGYMVFALYLWVRFRYKTLQSLRKASFIGTCVIFVVTLFVLLSVKGVTDAQANTNRVIGLNAALLVAILVTEIFSFSAVAFKKLPVKK